SPRCPVCARVDVAFDEVSHAGTLILAACRHCDHRWTARPPRRFAAVGAAMGGASRIRSSSRKRGESEPGEDSLGTVVPDPDLLLDLPF
ncbi:MAG: hypothetical protein JRG86_17110, partial [Deltaproteobacteria bacterium]|nr:hypothetical protein [Deltaproteobacteria bacterium]